MPYGILQMPCLTGSFFQWVKGLPKLQRMDYTINKARLTINGSTKDNFVFGM